MSTWCGLEQMGARGLKGDSYSSVLKSLTIQQYIRKSRTRWRAFVYMWLDFHFAPTKISDRLLLFDIYAFLVVSFCFVSSRFPCVLLSFSIPIFGLFSRWVAPHAALQTYFPVFYWGVGRTCPRNSGTVAFPARLV